MRPAISLDELLRIIQFHNTPDGSCHVQPGTEDGFVPGPWVSVKWPPHGVQACFRVMDDMDDMYGMDFGVRPYSP